MTARLYLTDADVDPDGCDAAEDAYVAARLGEWPPVTAAQIRRPALLEPEDLGDTRIDDDGYGWWDE